MDEPEVAAEDGLTIEGRLHDRMFRIDEDIRKFGNMCSAYRKRRLIGMFSWEYIGSENA